MTLIEGVGDEVVQFVGAVLTILVAMLAWWSTNAHPDRYRTVLVMRSRPTHPVTVSIRSRSNLMLLNTQPNGQASTSHAAVSNTSEPTEDTSRDNARVIPLQEMDSIVDADMAMLDNNRLHFYRRVDTPNTTIPAESTGDESEVQDEASSAQIREMDSIVSAMEADVTAGCDLFTRAPAINTANSPTKPEENKDGAANPNASETNPISDNENNENINSRPEHDDARNILIKLKYLNDTLKEVQGNLDELLKDFKLRHFSQELSSECRVRLIFNGRVLVEEAATLQALGLHDRAVVHCLVHPKRDEQSAQGSGGEETEVTHELVTERAQAERSWDLENILMTFVSVALTIVWFFRCEYSNMFTASASVALCGLTVFYSVAIFGLYLSDTFQFDRRAAPQHPPTNTD